MNKIKENSYILFALLIAIASAILFNIDGNLNFKDLTMDWNATHYAINYVDFGFIKRGLIGSFYNWIDGSFSQVSLLLFQSTFIIILIITTHFLFSSIGLQKDYIYLLFIISPATFMHFSSDFGRFDSILVSLFMLSVFFRKSTTLFFLFSILGILVHEIYTFSLLPAAFLLYFSDRADLNSFKSFLNVSIKNYISYALLASILVVISLGSYELGHEHILNTFSKSNLPSSYIELHKPSNDNFTIWTNSIVDNFNLTSTNRLSLSISTVYVIFIYLAILVYFKILGVNIRRPRYYLILLSSFPMFFLGTDWGRWLAFIFISIFIVFITTERDKAKKISSKHLLIFTLYGPLGVSASLPLLPRKISELLIFI